MCHVHPLYSLLVKRLKVYTNSFTRNDDDSSSSSSSSNNNNNSIRHCSIMGYKQTVKLRNTQTDVCLCL